MTRDNKYNTLLKRYNVTLPRATLWAIAGISYLFAFRTTATFFLSIFKNIWFFRIISITPVLAGLGIALFYFAFYKLYRIPDGEVVEKSRSPLRIATLMVLMGTLTVVLLFAKTVFVAFRIYNFPYPDSWLFLPVLVPLFSAICSLVFFLIFYKITVGKVTVKLTMAIMLVIIGGALGVVLRLIYSIHYLFSETVISMSELMAKFSVPTIPIMIIFFITSLHFFYRFYIEEKGKS